MKILLIDDDRNHCKEYMDFIKYLPYDVDLSIAYSCSNGIELTKSFQPDIIILDLELHKADGDGTLFLNELKGLKLSVIPFIIIITWNPSPRAHNSARECGADYIFPKSKPDYSPKLIFDFAFNYFVNKKDDNNSASVDDNENNLETTIAELVEKVGITNGISGRDYIVDGIVIILNLYKNKVKSIDIDLNTNVYPVIARNYKKTDKNVAQGIRNAIKRAWTTTDLDSLGENYTERISYKTGYPENRDFLFYYANKLKNKFLGHK